MQILIQASILSCKITETNQLRVPCVINNNQLYSYDLVEAKTLLYHDTICMIIYNYITIYT